MEKNHKKVSQDIKSTKSSNIFSLGKIETLALAIAAPIFYLNGRAYHDGYLSYLKLESSMFPLQATDVVGASAVAWFRVISNLFAEGLNGLGKNWLLYLILFVGLTFIFGITHHLTSKPSKKEPAETKPRSNSEHSFFKSLRTTAFAIFLVVYSIFTCLFAITAILALFISPFHAVGAQVAQEHLEKEFSDSPTIRLKAPKYHPQEVNEGQYLDFRLIQCSTNFCALYRAGRTFTVPVKTIDWAISDPITVPKNNSVETAD